MTPLDRRDFYLVQHGSRRWTDADVDAAEADLGIELPDGYRQLMTELGSGMLNDILRFYPPNELGERQRDFQALIQEYWFFNEPDEVLTREYVLESIELADSADGDQVIFNPRTRQLHVLPRHNEHTHEAGRDLWDVVAWFQGSGVLCRPHSFRYFESFAGPTEAVNGTGNSTDYDQVTTAVMSLALHDAVEDNGGDCTIFVKAIGGFVRFAATEDGPLYVHLRCQPDRSPEVRRRIQDTVTASGVTWGDPWAMSH